MTATDETPERVCVVWPNPRGAGLAFRAEKKQGQEYVRADLYAVLTAERADAKRLREAVETLLDWDRSRKYPIPYRVRDPLLKALANETTTQGVEHD